MYINIDPVYFSYSYKQLFLVNKNSNHTQHWAYSCPKERRVSLFRHHGSPIESLPETTWLIECFRRIEVFKGGTIMPRDISPSNSCASDVLFFPVRKIFIIKPFTIHLFKKKTHQFPWPPSAASPWTSRRGPVWGHLWPARGHRPCQSRLCSPSPLQTKQIIYV